MAIDKKLIDQLLSDYKKPEDIIGENGLLKELTKAILERALQAEMTDHLGYEKHDPAGRHRSNTRNGKSQPYKASSASWSWKRREIARRRSITRSWPREHYIAEFNGRFQVAPTQPGSAFVACRRKDLDLIFALQFERMVNRDNTVSLQNLSLQIERVNWQATLAGCSVTLHQHLDGTIGLTHEPHWLGCYSAQGVALNSNKNAAANGYGYMSKPKNQNRTFHLPQKADILTCYEQDIITGCR